MKLSNITFNKNLGAIVLVLLAALPFIYAERPGSSGGGRSAPAPRSEPHREPMERANENVNRSNHGTIRHADTHVVPHNVEVPHHFEQHQHAIVHRDVEVDVNRPRYWHGFVFGARHHRLREGCFHFILGGIPYYYDDGIYFQPIGDDFQEVFPPVGAAIPQLPDGAFEIDSGDTTYYYAGGAFYVQQGDGFVIVPTPSGVTVPELPPGAAQVVMNGTMVYTFNGVYYQPVFVDGVIQYTTFLP